MKIYTENITNNITVAICTGMGRDLTKLLESLVNTDCNEILIIGTSGHLFVYNKHLNDPRIRLLYAPHALSTK